ncbi:hypothetical protein KKG08_02645 [Patescibacteria group bacterium]|nr:hypothetical protein [Patescibacteria group bacterium]
MSKKIPSIISLLAPIISILAVAVAFGNVSKAADTSVVTATVTVQNISVEMVANSTISYGTIGTQSTQETTTNGLSTTPVANNNGNVTEDLSVKSQNSASWTLSSDTTANNYFHKVCNASCTTTGSWEFMTTSYLQVHNAVAASNSQPFDLRIGTPVTTASYTQQSVDVTVQAAAD